MRKKLALIKTRLKKSDHQLPYEIGIGMALMRIGYTARNIRFGQELWLVRASSIGWFYRSHSDHSLATVWSDCQRKRHSGLVYG
jgi:hypothetical protein